MISRNEDVNRLPGDSFYAIGVLDIGIVEVLSELEACTCRSSHSRDTQDSASGPYETLDGAFNIVNQKSEVGNTRTLACFHVGIVGNPREGKFNVIINVGRNLKTIH